MEYLDRVKGDVEDLLQKVAFLESNRLTPSMKRNRSPTMKKLVDDRGMTTRELRTSKQCFDRQDNGMSFKHRKVRAGCEAKDCHYIPWRFEQAHTGGDVEDAVRSNAYKTL